MRVGAFERERLGRLCRYLLRPPLSERRLTKVESTYLLELKTPWRDGTTHLVLSAEELATRLVALIPRPGKNQILYAGAFAPNARLRAKAVAHNRAAPEEARRRARLEARRRRNQRRGAPGNPTFAALMRRSFEVDISACAQCGGKLALVELVEEPARARALLEARGLLGPLEALLAPHKGRGPPSAEDAAATTTLELDEEALYPRLMEAAGYSLDGLDALEEDFDEAAGAAGTPATGRQSPPRSAAGGEDDYHIDLTFDFGA